LKLPWGDAGGNAGLHAPNNTQRFMLTLFVMLLARVVCPMRSMKASAQQDNHELQLALSL
jgi:hypothetical protein